MDTQPYKLLLWNVRGLNSPAKRSTIYQVVVAADPAIVCFQETKMEVMTLDIVRHCLGNKFENFFYLPAAGTRGGILITWDETVIKLSNPHYTTNTVTTLVSQMNGSPWWITGVYGPQSDVDKAMFMQELVDIRELHAGPSIIAGDFNLLVNPHDKNNNAVKRRMLAKFRRKTNMLELNKMYLNGRSYTWSNERRRPTMEKIDHIFTTNCWDDLHPAALLTALGSAISDHCPLLLDLKADYAYGRRFHFEQFWPKAEGFFEIVEVAWNSVVAEGNAYIVLDKKLRATAKALQRWSDRWIGNVRLQIAIALEVIARLDTAMDNRALSDAEFELRKILKRKLLGLCSLQRSIARQRSRILQLKEGEANTAYFQRHARHRQRKNLILSLTSDGHIYTGQDNVAAAVDAYDGKLLGSTAERRSTINLEVLELPSRDLAHLDAPF